MMKLSCSFFHLGQSLSDSKVWGQSFARSFRFILLACLIIPVCGIAAHATDFRGITPAHSGKDLVRARLGKPTFESEDRMEFSDRTGKSVVFFYTIGDTQQLNLSRELAGRVLTIYFYPVKPAKYDLNGLAHKGLIVGHGWNDQGEKMISYDDGERGISYHFLKDDTHVWRIVYYAPRTEFAKFKLPDQPDQDKLL